MYGFNNDKSKWNLGEWGKFWAARTDFIPGIASEDANIREKFPTKYVYKYNVTTNSAGDTAIKMACQGVQNPSILWAVLHNVSNAHSGVFGLYELTEDEQEDANIIEDVFFQNEYIYVVATEQPNGYMWFAIKGA